MFGFYFFGAIALIGLIVEGAKWYEESQANTPEKKEALLIKRIAKYHREKGHPNPERAARDEIEITIYADKFNRYACDEYTKPGAELDAIKRQWWKENSNLITRFVGITHNTAESLQYMHRLEAYIMGKFEEDTFIYDPAKTKWERKRKIMEEDNKVAMKRIGNWCDPSYEHVIEGLWDGRRGL